MENKENKDAIDLDRALFVLGAQDGEMREIEAVLKKAGLRFAHASMGSERANSGQAYGAPFAIWHGIGARPRQEVLPANQPLVYVECSVGSRQAGLRIDHHQPGDPGFEAPPERYLEGSSLGQLLSLLGISASEDQKLLAAADHCLSAAYAGLCPGVDPDELLFMRASWQALISKRSLSDAMCSILKASEAARKRFDEKLGVAVFSDPTRTPRDLPEGAARAGVPVVYRGLMPDGTHKEMFKGGSLSQIEDFMRRHAEAGRRVYGNPHRGYAGAYL